jgi:hypothetical protein
MKKSGTAKLKLHLETLRNLDGEILVEARGRLLIEVGILLDTATCVSFKRCSGCNPCATSN